MSLAANASAKPHRFYGVVSQTPLSSPEIAKMAKARIGTLRALMHWAAIDPSAAPDDYQWGAFDTLVADAAVNRVEVLPVRLRHPYLGGAGPRSPELRRLRRLCADATSRR